MTEVALNGHSQASNSALGLSNKKTRKRASTRWGPDPDDADLAIQVGDRGQDGEAQTSQAVADASGGASETAGLARRKPKRSRWGPDEEGTTPAVPQPDHDPAVAASSQENRRKPKRSRWGPDDAPEAEAFKQQATPVTGADARSAVTRTGKPKRSRWGPDEVQEAVTGLVQVVQEPLPEQPSSAAAQVAAQPQTSVTKAAAVAVEEALQATGLEPKRDAAADEAAAEAAAELQPTPPGENFALPEGVDPLAVVLLRRRGDPEGTTAATAAMGGPPPDLSSDSTSDMSETAGDNVATDAEAAVSSAPAQPSTATVSQPTDMETVKASKPGIPPPTTSHVQAMVRVFEPKPPGQLPAHNGQLPWASGTQRAVPGLRPQPPPIVPAAIDRELTLLEEARALAAQAAAEHNAVKHASQTAAYLASQPDTRIIPPPQLPAHPPPQAPTATSAAPPVPSLPTPLQAPAAPSAPAPPQPSVAASLAMSQPDAVTATATAAAGEPAPPGAEAAQPAGADPYGGYGYYGQYGYYAAAAAGDPYAAHYAAAYGQHYDPYTAYSAAAAGYDPYAADAANAEQWAAYYAQAFGQTMAETAEPEVPPGTEDEKPAEEIKPKKEPKVQVVPLPPPSLEPPKVVVRVPKAVRERQEAAAAAAAQKEAATAVDANAAPASEDAPEQAEPTSEVGGIPSLEQPSYAKTAALASRGSDAEGAEKESDKAQPREREVKSRSPVRRRSLSLSPALSIERSPPARKGRRHRRADPSASPPPRRSHRNRAGRGNRGSRRSVSPRRPRRGRSPRGARRSITPRPQRSPSVQEPERSPSPAESVESGEIPGGPDATAGGVQPVAAARSPSRSPEGRLPGRWQEPSTEWDSRTRVAAYRPPPPARGSGGPSVLRGRGGGRRGALGGRGAPPDRWELDSFEGGPPRGREGTGPSNDRWELDSGSGGYSGGRSADQGQYSGQQGWERGRERGDSEIYPAASQGFRSQPMVVPVSSVVPAGPYGIYGGLAAGQLGLAPMGGRTGAFPPVRGRGPRPPPGPPPGGRGRGRW